MAIGNTVGKAGRRRFLIPAIAVTVAVVVVLSTVLILVFNSAARSLVIKDPNLSLDGIDVFEAAEKTHQPDAGDPSYVYLITEEEGVVLYGPDIQSSDIYYLENESITQVNDGSDHSNEGFEVKINAHLSYEVVIEDFEQEVGLAEVKLTVHKGVLNSSFVFVAIGEGVAHDVTITAFRDGVSKGNSTPIHIECAKRWIPVQAQMRVETVTGGYKGVFESVDPSPSWSQTIVTLIEYRGTNSAQNSWTPMQSDLDGGVNITYTFPDAPLGSLTVAMAINDIAGDGLVSVGDSITVTTVGQGFDPSCRYVLWMVDYSHNTILEITLQA